MSQSHCDLQGVCTSYYIPCKVWSGVCGTTPCYLIRVLYNYNTNSAHEVSAHAHEVSAHKPRVNSRQFENLRGLHVCCTFYLSPKDGDDQGRSDEFKYPVKSYFWLCWRLPSFHRCSATPLPVTEWDDIYHGAVTWNWTNFATTLNCGFNHFNGTYTDSPEHSTPTMQTVNNSYGFGKYHLHHMHTRTHPCAHTHTHTG